MTNGKTVLLKRAALTAATGVAGMIMLAVTPANALSRPDRCDYDHDHRAHNANYYDYYKTDKYFRAGSYNGPVISVSFGNRRGYDKRGYNSRGYNRYGYDRYGYNKFGYNKNGYNKFGYNEYGYNKRGYNKHGYNKHGYNEYGYNKHGYNKHGYNKHGYNEHGYNEYGYNDRGYDRYGRQKTKGRKHNAGYGYGGAKLLKKDVYRTKFHAKIIAKEQLVYNKRGAYKLCNVTARGPESGYVPYRRLKKISRNYCSYDAKITINGR